MKIILLILILILLSGCVYNLTNFTLPNDEEFTTIVVSLDTPQKICNYMKDNFEYKLTWTAYSPYQMWLLNTKAGDCNDYATFAIFVAHYHGYEVYLMTVYADYDFESFLPVYHVLGIFVENGKYNYSSNSRYYPIQVDTFEKIVNHHIEMWDIELYRYKIYDYNNNLIGGK